VIPIAPFSIRIGEEVLSDLRARIRSTRWPDPAPGADVVVAAALAGGRTEAARRVGVARPRPAQADHGGQILLPFGRGGGDPVTFDGARDTAFQKGRRHLDGVARHDGL